MQSNTSRLIRFPSERTGHPARVGASARSIFTLRLRKWLGDVANKIRIPGAISACEIQDRATGQKIAVTVEALFVRLTVNGRDFYFNRLTGRFDGTGTGNID